MNYLLTLKSHVCVCSNTHTKLFVKVKKAKMNIHAAVSIKGKWSPVRDLKAKSKISRLQLFQKRDE